MVMEIRTLVGGLSGIAAESAGIFSANPKAMAFFTLFTPVIYSLLYLSNVFSAKPLIGRLLRTQTSLLLASPGTPAYAALLAAVKSDVSLFFALEWLFLLAMAAASLFFAAATVLTSAVACSGKQNLSLREVLGRSLKLIKNPLVTSFYTTLLGLGYVWLALLLLLPIALLFLGNNTALLAASVVLALLAGALHAYLSVVWTLALVVSVVEERSGMEALGKAKELVKGSEGVGFCLNVVIEVVALIVYEGMRFVAVKEWKGTQVMVGLAALNGMCLVKVFGLVGFTVLYYRCKKSHGQQLELLDTFDDYTKVPINQDMA